MTRVASPRKSRSHGTVSSPVGCRLTEPRSSRLTRPPLRLSVGCSSCVLLPAEVFRRKVERQDGFPVHGSRCRWCYSGGDGKRAWPRLFGVDPGWPRSVWHRCGLFPPRRRGRARSRGGRRSGSRFNSTSDVGGSVWELRRRSGRRRWPALRHPRDPASLARSSG